MLVSPQAFLLTTRDGLANGGAAHAIGLTGLVSS
jgi:hypothetical protein